MAKMWAGRTDGQVEKIADDFNSSIRFDCRMYRQDIQGSMAHAAMLAGKGIITEADADALFATVQKSIADVATAMRSGCIDTADTDMGQNSPCRFCAYARVCRKQDVKGEEDDG